MKDTVAEMTAKAHEISLEAGSKMAAAMKDVVNAAAGLTEFVLESARDLVQYMVRRGQMTQEEADKLIRQAEEAQVGRPVPVPRAPEPEPAPVRSAPVATADNVPVAPAAAPKAPAAVPAKPAAAKAPTAPAKTPAKPAPKADAKPAAKTAAKKPAARTAHKSDNAHAAPAAPKKAAKTATRKAPAKRK